MSKNTENNIEKQPTTKELLIELVEQIPDRQAEYLFELINTLSYLETRGKSQ